MKWTGLNELREMFLSFFEEKGHHRLKSFPLVPRGDNSLLLINSGMAPLKKYFLGQETPPNKRAVSCQKCIRTPDIERVGKTSRHGTYFEMLGNFSFGDYFKTEATAWAWEFITQTLEIPADKLYISIFESDDEAFEIWTKNINIPPERIVRLGREDNFWEIGSGPCGPCSEIYFDRGAENGCGSPDCKVGCDCDRYVEFWNLVFSQFNSDGKGNYAPMEHPNIDTGMGLERLACIMQGVDNLFEVDTVQNIMKHIGKIAKITYKQDKEADISLRVITDHIRSTVFMLGDGVIPSNEGRGYVLRRLLRRAARHGKLIGISEPFLFEVAGTVAGENEKAYPELLEKIDYIKKIIKTEEENFSKTIDKGIELLNSIVNDIKSSGKSKIISGEDAFKLYDTYGFPIDLMHDIIGEDIGIDEDVFHKLMQEQKERARNARRNSVSAGWSDGQYDFGDEKPTEFLGYTQFESEASLEHIIISGEDGFEERESVGEGEAAGFLFDKTPFYAESGGQVSDSGEFICGDSVIRIDECKKLSSGQYIHAGTVVKGEINNLSSGILKIDIEKRRAIMRNHTAAHLLQKALKNVLGAHINQAGQLVDENRVRFDFNHFSALTPEQLKLVEDEVNSKILEALTVSISETDIETANNMGAVALFGEKYGDTVRVVNAGGYSLELCGGTHVENTSMLGLFRILGESSVAAGIRRIEGVTGTGVLKLAQSNEAIIKNSCAALKVSNPSELEKRCAAVLSELKDAQKNALNLSGELLELKIGSIFDKAPSIGGISLASVALKDVSADTLKAAGDKLKDKNPSGIAVIASILDSKGTVMAVCGKNAVAKGAHAGKIAGEIAALTGGKGGGRPDTAMAGIQDISMTDKALEQLQAIASKYIKAD